MGSESTSVGTTKDSDPMVGPGLSKVHRAHDAASRQLASARTIKRLHQIRNHVVRMLQSQGQSQQVLGRLRARSIKRRATLDERLRPTETGRSRHQPQPRRHRQRLGARSRRRNYARARFPIHEARNSVDGTIGGRLESSRSGLAVSLAEDPS